MFEFLSETVNYKFRIPLQKQGAGSAYRECALPSPLRRFNITGILIGVETKHGARLPKKILNPPPPPDRYQGQETVVKSGKLAHLKMSLCQQTAGKRLLLISSRNEINRLKMRAGAMCFSVRP